LVIVVVQYPLESMYAIGRVYQHAVEVKQYISGWLASLPWPSIHLPLLVAVLISIIGSIIYLAMIAIEFYIGLRGLLALIKWVKHISLIPVENKRFTNWKREICELDAKGFLESITFYHPIFSRAALNHILMNNLLKGDEETVFTLKFFIGYLQHSLEKRKAKLESASTSIPMPTVFQEWLASYQKNYNSELSVFGYDSLELANRLLEKLVTKK
jgi:hypothetical protein